MLYVTTFDWKSSNKLLPSENYEKSSFWVETNGDSSPKIKTWPEEGKLFQMSFVCLKMLKFPLQNKIIKGLGKISLPPEAK